MPRLHSQEAVGRPVLSNDLTPPGQRNERTENF